jgi:hypothetical protein
MLLLEIFKRYFEGFVHYLKGILETDKMLKLFKILSEYFWQKYVHIIKHVSHVSLQYFHWKYWFPHPVLCTSVFDYATATSSSGGIRKHPL